MATVNLGRIKFVWQGAYSGATAYVADDVVSYNGSSYICILASTNNLPTNATYWSIMSSAGTNGTNGTDVGTTITTQGDILYRNASGLARLGAGTNGQVLTTAGASANPSWSTVSSDFVLLATTIQTSAVASVSFDGFSDTYYSFQVDFAKVVPSTSGVKLMMRYRRNNADVTTSYYRSTIGGSETTSGHSGNNGQSGGLHDDNKIQLFTGNTISNNDGFPHAGVDGYVKIFNARDTGSFKRGIGQNTHNRTDNAVYLNHQVGFVDNSASTEISGVTFFFDSGNIAGGKFKLYGIK
jgi:hypothetical protein